MLLSMLRLLRSGGRVRAMSIVVRWACAEFVAMVSSFV